MGLWDINICMFPGLERAIIKLESIRILISCMLLTQLHDIVCLADSINGRLSPNVYCVQIDMMLGLLRVFNR